MASSARTLFAAAARSSTSGYARSLCAAPISARSSVPAVAGAAWQHAGVRYASTAAHNESLASSRTQTGPVELGFGTTITPRAAETRQEKNINELGDYPDYSKGPSALDKASTTFFFLEIVRGMGVVLEQFFRCVLLLVLWRSRLELG